MEFVHSGFVDGYKVRLEVKPYSVRERCFGSASVVNEWVLANLCFHKARLMGSTHPCEENLESR